MRRRSREVNIFNMSLLDILCGALGAFCFMMLVLMPYYKPPKEQVDIQKKQREIQDELKKLAEMKDKISDAQMARDLEELVKKLQAQVNELQGRLNYTLAENERLKEELERIKRERDQALAENQQLRKENEALQREIQPLRLENEALKREIQPLRDENQRLRTQNERLLSRNQQLEQDNQKLRQRVSDLMTEKEKLQYENNLLRLRQPFLVKAVAADPVQDVALYVLDPAVYKTLDGKDNPVQAPFDPTLRRQTPKYPGDIGSWVENRGVAEWVIREVIPSMRLKVYANFANAPERRADSLVHVGTTQYVGGTMEFPDFRLTKEHPWIYVGDILGNPGSTLVLKPATQAEREQEWKEVGSAGPASDRPALRYGSGGPSGEQQRRRAAAGAQAEIAGLRARIAIIKAHPATDRVGAERQQMEIANLENSIKILERTGVAPPVTPAVQKPPPPPPPPPPPVPDKK